MFNFLKQSITVNGFKVTEPIRKPLNILDLYFVASTSCLSGNNTPHEWSGFESDYFLLELGICHKSKEAAIIHSGALMSFTCSPYGARMLPYSVHPNIKIDKSRIIPEDAPFYYINGFKIPAPIRKPLKHGDKYYLAGSPRHSQTWTGEYYEKSRLDAGLIHTDISAAIEHTKALFSITATEKGMEMFLTIVQ